MNTQTQNEKNKKFNKVKKIMKTLGKVFLISFIASFSRITFSAENVQKVDMAIAGLYQEPGLIA